MMIKICGITRREDALAAVEAGASALGFIFYKPSPRYVTPEKAAALAGDLNVLRVGVFVDETPAAVEALARTAQLDVVQFYGTQLYGGTAPPNTRVWRALRITAGVIPDVLGGCEAIVLDGAKNGVSFDWRLARNAALKVILAGGLNPSNVAEAIRIAQPWGVDASSGLETAPGIKDHGKMRAFVIAAQEASVDLATR